MERILHQLSKVVRSAILSVEVHPELISHVLHDLVDLETRPMCLTEIAYDWCSAICESRQSLSDQEFLLFTSLEVGFRHLDPQNRDTVPTLTHTEHHLEMIDIVLKSQNSDAIADLLCSWIIGYSLHIPRNTCAERLVCLHNLVPFSSRLRQLVILSVGLVGYEGFEGVEVERLIELLNHLHVTLEDMIFRAKWATILANILQTSKGLQLLSHWYWELLVELSISQPRSLWGVTYNPQTMIFLTEAQEWSKLECWMGTVWMIWPPEAYGITEEDLSYSMLLLLRQRPGALQKLEQWMERRSQEKSENIPESFQRICKQAQEAARQDTP